MIKLLIVDDEPLVQIGMKSIIDWESLGIEICGTASNGDTAYELICKYHPEIVITDIQMPCSSGLELGKRCKEEFGSLPVFIILTSYEDFSYAKEAMQFQAADYLIKIDLTPEILTTAVKKTLELVRQRQPYTVQTSAPIDRLALFKERFYIRLLNNLFESREQCLLQAEEFSISIQAASYAAAYVKFMADSPNKQNNALQIYHQTLNMLRELLGKYVECHIIELDTNYFAIIFMLKEDQLSDWIPYLTSSLSTVFQMLNNYYNVTLQTCIGRLVDDPLSISTSYYDAKQLSSQLSSDTTLLFWNEIQDISSLRNVFNLSLFRDEIVKAFEETNETALRKILDDIIEILSGNPVPYNQALDAASSILHLSINLLPDGQILMNNIFKTESDTYSSLYRQKTVDAIVLWLSALKEGLCTAFANEKRSRRNYLVSNCCKYINEHIHERILLQDIAKTFDVSPNYIGQLFKKHMNIGINEYIANQKIAASKRLLKETTLKIYEISSQLGFESAFYFSKVFKKYTGLSPKDYRNI